MGLGIGSMFSGLSSNNSMNTTMNNNMNKEQGLSLGDYAAIKNGSYGKLMKAYYKNQSTSNQTGNKTSTKSSLSMVKSEAEGLKKSAHTLMNSNLWEKKTITTKNEDGTTTEKKDYDRDAITKAIKSFADSYNNVLDKAGDSTNKNVLRSGVGMTEVTNRTASGMFGKVGIKIGVDNKLTVDEDKLKSADISDLKTLFSGNGSFADQIMTKASAMSRATENSSGIYTRNATYSSELNNLVAGSIDASI